MTDTDRATERALRVAAIAKHDGACEVLADFYDERGQPSRAQLWRNPQRDERCAGERDRTVIHTLVRASPVDPRRDALIWIYSLADRSLAQIGTQFKLSRERIRGIVNRIDCKVHFDAARADRLTTIP